MHDSVLHCSVLQLKTMMQVCNLGQLDWRTGECRVLCDLEIVRRQSYGVRFLLSLCTLGFLYFFGLFNYLNLYKFLLLDENTTRLLLNMFWREV